MLASEKWQQFIWDHQ